MSFGSKSNSHKLLTIFSQSDGGHLENKSKCGQNIKVMPELESLYPNYQEKWYHTDFQMSWLKSYI